MATFLPKTDLYRVLWPWQQTLALFNTVCLLLPVLQCKDDSP